MAKIVVGKGTKVTRCTTTETGPGGWRGGVVASLCACALAFPAVWFITAGEADPLVRITILLFLLALYLRRTTFGADPAIWLALGFTLTLLLGYAYQLSSVPEAVFGGSSARHYLYVFYFFLPIAYGTILWRPFSPFLVLLSAAGGSVAYLLLHVGVDDWVAAWNGERVAYGFWNAQYAGVVFGSGLLAVTCFAPRLFFSVSGAFRIVVALITLAFFSVMLWGTLTTQVRAVWLGLVLAFATGLVIAVVASSARAFPRRLGLARLAGLLIVGMIVSGALFIGLDGHERVLNRLVTEEITFDSMRGAAHFDPNKMSSSGVRIASWTASLDWIRERPLLGWGGLSVKRLIRTDERFDDQFKKSFGHLHNSYLEAMVAVGGLGVLFLIATIVFVGVRTTEAWRRREMPTDAFLFSWVFFTFWLTVNCFESYINSSTGVYLVTVTGGFAYAFCLGGRGYGLRRDAT